MSNFITCIGDSLTQFGIPQAGWLSLLNSYYERQMQLLCFGYSGYNTKWILSHLGTNDCCTDTIQHVSCDEYISNMQRILENVLQFSIKAKIFVLSPIPTVRPERKDAEVYSKAFMGLTSDIVYVDLFLYKWEEDDYCDQLHLSDKGNHKIFEILKKVLGAQIQVNRKLPDWKELK